jgi:general secretion pathway protein I
MRARGFTLVEVMVALAIVAIALPALLMALYQQLDDTAYLRDKTFAHLVAANKLDEMRLVIASTRNLTAGKDNGKTTLADRDWFWWVETKTTEMDKFYRTEISVGLSEDKNDQPLYTLTGFMSSDLQVDPEGLTSDGSGGGGNNGEDSQEEDATGSESDAQLTPNTNQPPQLPDGLKLELPGAP